MSCLKPIHRNIAVLIVIAGLILALFITGCNKSGTSSKNRAPEVTAITATPANVGYGDQSKIKLDIKDSDGDAMTVRWHCDDGQIVPSMAKSGELAASRTQSDSANWVAPAAKGIYPVEATISDGTDSTETSVNVNVKGYFYDDFSSGSVAKWLTSYCTRWIEDGWLHVEGNNSSYLGTAYHSFNPYVTPDYTVSMKLARVGTAGTDDCYGIYLFVNDAGSPYVPVYWFRIYPNNTSYNWIMTIYIGNAGSNSGWYTIDENSIGTSALINTGTGQENNVSLTLEADLTIIVRVGPTVLYQSDELQALANALGRALNIDARWIGIRAVPNFEVMGDNVLVDTDMIVSAARLSADAEAAAYDISLQAPVQRPEEMRTLAELIRALK